MRRTTAIFTSLLILMGSFPASFADVVSSDEALMIEQHQYNKQQILSFMDRDDVQSRLVSLGVDSNNAKDRVANMTDAEISALNSQIQNMPAAGSVGGTVVTVLVVIVVLDLLGLTDVFSFIDPIV